MQNRDGYKRIIGKRIKILEDAKLINVFSRGRYKNGGIVLKIHLRNLVETFGSYHYFFCLARENNHKSICIAFFVGPYFSLIKIWSNS